MAVYRIPAVTVLQFPRVLHRYLATTVPLTVSAPSVIIRYAKYLQSVYCNAPLTFPDKLAPTMNSDYIKLALVSRMELRNRKEADEFTQLTLQGDIDLILNKKNCD